MRSTKTLDAMSEDDKAQALLSDMDTYGAVRIDNKQQMAFWGQTIQALLDAGLIEVKWTGCEQSTWAVARRKTPNEIVSDTQELLASQPRPRCGGIVSG